MLYFLKKGRKQLLKNRKKIHPVVKKLQALESKKQTMLRNIEKEVTPDENKSLKSDSVRQYIDKWKFQKR